MDSTTLQGYWIRSSFFRVDRVHRGVGPWASYNRHTISVFLTRSAAILSSQGAEGQVDLVGSSFQYNRPVWHDGAGQLWLQVWVWKERWDQQYSPRIQGKPISFGYVVPQAEQHQWLSLTAQEDQLSWSRKKIDWWPALAVMLCGGSGQSDLSKGAFPCPFWRVIILFSNLRCFTPSSLCPCAGLAPVSPYFSCTGCKKQNWMQQSTCGLTKD